jgi:hypothetical protein
MSKRGVIALSVVAALLLGYVLAFERTSVTSKELDERKARVLVSFVRDKVDRLELERQGKRVVLERKPAKEGELRAFRVTAPFEAPADQDVVDRLLGELEWLSARRTLEPLTPEDQKRFGLAAPRYRVAFTIGGARHQLEVGHDDVHGESVYVRLDRAARAYVVPKTLLEVLDHEPGAFRDKQLLPDLTVAWARRLVLTRAEGKTELSKEGERWWLNGAPRGYADGRRAEELLHGLSELRASRYVEAADLPRAEAALKRATLRVEVHVVPDEAREDKAAKSLGLEVADGCEGHAGERYARTFPSAALVCIRDEDVKPLLRSEMELRELRLLIAEASAVEKIELAGGGSKLQVEREGEKWKAPAPSGAAVDREAVEGWLAALAQARAVRVLPLTAFAERGSLTLDLAGDARERLLFGDLDGRGELLVKRGDEPLVLAFPASAHDLLQPWSGRFATLEVWAAHQPSEVQRIEARDEGRSRLLVVDGGAWRAQGAASTPASDAGSIDSDRTRELVRALIDLRVRAFVSEQARPAHQIASTTQLKLALAQGGSLSLELGGPTAAGAYARIDGKQVVEVERDTIAILRELAGGPRTLLAPAAGQPSAAGGAHDEHEDHGDHEDHAH